MRTKKNIEKKSLFKTNIKKTTKKNNNHPRKSKEKNEKQTIRMSLYLDSKTKNSLDLLSKTYQRSNNSLISFLINKEKESIQLDNQEFLAQWKPLKQSVNLDNINIRDFAHD